MRRTGQVGRRPELRPGAKGTGEAPRAGKPGSSVALTLTSEEREIVRKTLGHYLDDLRRETTSTDNPGMNAWLNRQAQVVQRLMTRLTPGPTPQPRTGKVPAVRRGRRLGGSA